jgi:N-acetylated-alpha-linked acidic dipeptidase
VVPFEFGSVAEDAGQWVEEIVKLAGTNASKLNLKPVTEALAQVRAANAGYEAALADLKPAQAVELNRVLRDSERSFTLADGLPGRSWYKNQLYAPGVYTGYSAKTLPGIREAVEAGRWDEANRQAETVAGVLREFRRQVDRAADAARRAR